MKRLLLSILFLSVLFRLSAQKEEVSGIVLDEKGQPLSYANVYLEGTMDGASTLDDGSFSFATEQAGKVTLIVSSVGYEMYKKADDVKQLKNLSIKLRPVAQEIGEVVAMAGNYLLKSSSTLEKKNAVDLVSTAGSDGDLYRAISILPGAQAPGVDGKLLVRGGDSRESQTYIDGMHVLNPYTVSSETTSSRGRFSPFLFDGINFSMGGYSPEYTQGLSSVLPLDTKNVSDQSKFGIGLMNVNSNIGGTKAWKKASVSFDVTYTDLQQYFTLTNPAQKKNWEKPFRGFTGQTQARYQLGERTFLKAYINYEKGKSVHKERVSFGSEPLNVDYEEENLYSNMTFRTSNRNGFTFFAGAAYAWNDLQVGNSRLLGDQYNMKQSELHLKTKAAKRFSSFYKLEIGAETYLRKYDMAYRDTLTYAYGLDHHIDGLFVSNDFNLTSHLFLNISGRLEHTSLNGKTSFLPRIALNYEWKGITFSGVAGRYQQLTANDYLLYNPKQQAEKNTQYMVGMYYQHAKKIYRVELYHKEYDKLPLLQNGVYTSDGNGHSRGVDLFFNDRAFLKHWEYMVGYSYNDSRRLWLSFPEKATPNFVTRHNGMLSVKYNNWKLKSIFAVTNRIASGRSYHDPNKPGFMNATSPMYHTLDLAWTFLAHKKLIIYVSASNVLNRANITGYNYAATPNAQGRYEARAIKNEQPWSVYIGFFLTLGKNVAYDASNF